MNGREAADAAPVLEALPEIEQYIFCSSAGVYLKSDQMPHREEDATDPKSRHKVRAAFTHLFWMIQAPCLSIPLHSSSAHACLVDWQSKALLGEPREKASSSGVTREMSL